MRVIFSVITDLFRDCKMISLPESIRQDLVTLVPACFFKEISCFVYHDNHPRSRENIDITICTVSGEIKEFYKRDLIASTVIDDFWKPQDIRILRNSKCDLFYIISHADELALVSSGEKLQVVHKINNIYAFEVDDSSCRGKANLKIIFKDDAVPLYFDENFEKLEDRAEILCKDDADDSLPIVTELARKLTEAKFSVESNEKVLKDLISLRQVTNFSNYKNNSTKEDDAVFHENGSSSGSLKINTGTPWIKMCNNKIIIIVEVVNKSTLLAENVHMLIHTAQESTVYCTKLFEAATNPPYWKEKTSNNINCNQNVAVALVFNIENLKYKIDSKIHLSGVISYKTDSKQRLLPFESINLSSIDSMGKDFDVLFNIQENSNKYNILAILSTSIKTELCLRHIKSDCGANINLLNMFCEHLNMEMVANTFNIALHRHSPYHVLHGVMIVEEKEMIGESKWIMSLYTRSEDQILAFIHYMHDAIPYRIVTTSTAKRITSQAPQFSKYDELNSHSAKNIDYLKLTTCMVNQTSMTLEYLDRCMMKMNQSKNAAVQSKVGREIDIFAGGVSCFEEYRNRMLEETSKGIKSVFEENGKEDLEGMVIDIDD